MPMVQKRTYPPDDGVWQVIIRVLALASAF